MHATDRAAMTYAASVNPPRRAKRLRTRSPSPIEKTQTCLPSIAPASRNPSPYPYDTAPVYSDGEDEDVVASIPQPKRRGRKPSTLSRAARDSMRRQNHSRIEKARRTKINDALATLRQLVPSGTRRTEVSDEEAEDDDDDEEFEVGRREEKKPKQEKEFKLEILEKTVVYVQELQARLRALEDRPCARRAGETREALQRPTRGQKRQRVDELEETDPDEDDFGTPILSSRSDPHKVLASFAKPAADTSPSPLLLPTTSNARLPSISSWLPQASVDPGFLSERTTMRSFSHRRPSYPAPVQLPTPPTSATLRPTPSLKMPPALSLDLPSVSPHAQSFTQMHATSTSQSNPWTPEDESAASLLLQIRTLSSPDESRVSQEAGRVQTPASLLGMKVKVT